MNPGANGVLAYDPGKRPLPYVKGGKLFFLFLAVLLFHGVAVILPFFVLKISDLLNPPLAVEKVSLVESAPNDNEIATPFPSPKNPVNKGVPPKGEEKDEFTMPDLDPIPPVPVKKEVKEEVKEEEKKPVKEEVKKEEKKEEEVKPLEVPSKKDNPVKETKKPIKKKITDPSEIKVSTRTVKTTKKTTPRTRTSTSPQGKSDAQKRARIRARMKDYDREKGKDGIPSSASPYGREGGTGEAGGAGGPKGVTSRELVGYYEQVRVYLMRSWQQPNTAMLNNARPEVLVLIHVDASGRILSARITKRSGNSAMDSSVEDLLNRVKVLPKPPKELTFTVNVNIE
ncbi:MAG: TonB C-terminal domain-containing protein [Lentisphaeria bacterium]|nr:TonB C-terminal domain-containing protein [Lentisphaeria bacterium]